MRKRSAPRHISVVLGDYLAAARPSPTQNGPDGINRDRPVSLPLAEPAYHSPATFSHDAERADMTKRQLLQRQSRERAELEQRHARERAELRDAGRAERAERWHAERLERRAGKVRKRELV